MRFQMLLCFVLSIPKQSSTYVFMRWFLHLMYSVCVEWEVFLGLESNDIMMKGHILFGLIQVNILDVLYESISATDNINHC